MAVWFERINLTTLLLCVVVIVFGAYVRLSDAGLGCPDWPGCYGHLTVPQADHAVAAAEAKYPQRPVEAPKAWKEMIHRYLASTLGLLILALALMSMRIRGRGRPKLLPWALVALVIFQAVLGMWTVTWQLKPLAVTGHLLGGMSTMSVLLWLYLTTRRLNRADDSALKIAATAAPNAAPISTPKGLRGAALVALVLVTGQLFLGGWTSTNYAALACPDFPTCHGSYLPDTDLSTAFTLWHGLGINYEYGILDARARVTIHYVHRIGALVLATALVLLGLWLFKRGGTWRGWGLAVIAALTLQVSIGIAAVILYLPLSLAAAHNAGAALLLAVIVSLNHRAWAQRPL